jgi:hypothetical protein
MSRCICQGLRARHRVRVESNGEWHTWETALQSELTEKEDNDNCNAARTTVSVGVTYRSETAKGLTDVSLQVSECVGRVTFIEPVA